jgi:TRAP transporter TAXI family solute receptor
LSSKVIYFAVVTICATGLSACRSQTDASARDTLRVVASGKSTGAFLGRYRAAFPEMHITLEDDRGSYAVISALQEGRADVGFAQADVVYRAYRTALRQTSSTAIALRGIAVRQSVNLYVVVRRASSYRAIDDLRHRRIGIARAGLHAEAYTRMIFGAYGVNDASATFEPHEEEEMAALLENGELDAATFGGVAVPDLVARLNKTVGVRLLPLGNEALTTLRGYYPFFNRIVVTPAQLPGQPIDVQSVGVDSLMICRHDLADDDVYRWTRALFDGAVATGANPLPADDVNRAAATPIPLHPGAARYYREREVLQ